MPKASETGIAIIPNGAVELYHDNVKTAYTKGTGFEIKGGNTSDQTELQIIGNEGQDASILLGADDGDNNADYWRMYSQASDNAFTLKNYAAGSYETSLRAVGNGAVELYHNNVKVIETNTTGIQVGFDGGVSNPTIKLPDNGYLTWGTSDVAYIQGADAGSGAYLMFNANNTQRMKIHDDGSIIIGSTSKSSTAGAGGLDIQGNSTNCVLEMGNPFPNVSGGVNPEFRITATNSNHTIDFESVWGGTNQLYKHLAFAGGATMIYDGTSNTEVGRFTGEGLVVGSTTFSNAHNTDPGACVFENGQVMCRRDNTMFTAKSIATGSQNAMRMLSAQTQVGSISFNSGGTSFNTSSDYRRKENVIDLTDAITRLKTLKPKRFNFISNPSVTLDGFLAHEVTTVPEAITGTKDEVATEDGEEYKKGDPIYQQLDQSKLVPLLVAALQEAVARIEALEGS